MSHELWIINNLFNRDVIVIIIFICMKSLICSQQDHIAILSILLFQTIATPGQTGVRAYPLSLSLSVTASLSPLFVVSPPLRHTQTAAYLSARIT